jgi:probable HAF family extracellular repeat protein
MAEKLALLGPHPGRAPQTLGRNHAVPALSLRHRSPRAQRPGRLAGRPRLEALEDRCLLDGGLSYHFATFDAPGAARTQGFGINDLGQVVGTVGTVNGSDGFLLSGGNYTPIKAPGAALTDANGINLFGQVVGDDLTGGSFHGFLLSGGTYTALDEKPGASTFALGINDLGQVVGSFNDATGHHGFLLQGDSYTPLDVPGGGLTTAEGINDLGQVVGNYRGGVHGFLLQGGSYTPLDMPGASSTDARGINNLGQVVGSFNDATGTTHGFLLSGGDYTALDVPGADFTQVFGINDLGQIVGFYSAGGPDHGFVATPAVNVTSSVDQPVLWPPNHRLVNVGLQVSVTPSGAPLQVQVYGNDGAVPSDAADIGPGTLELRATRHRGGDGRVYLIVSRATDLFGDTGFDVTTVVVPHDHSPESLAAVQDAAAAAESYFRQFQTAPPGFHLLGASSDDSGGDGAGPTASGGGALFPLPPSTVANLRTTPVPASGAPPAPPAAAPAGQQALPVDGLLIAAREAAGRYARPDSQGAGTVADPLDLLADGGRLLDAQLVLARGNGTDQPS